MTLITPKADESHQIQVKTGRLTTKLELTYIGYQQLSKSPKLKAQEVLQEACSNENTKNPLKVLKPVIDLCHWIITAKFDDEVQANYIFFKAFNYAQRRDFEIQDQEKASDLELANGTLKDLVSLEEINSSKIFPKNQIQEEIGNKAFSQKAVNIAKSLDFYQVDKFAIKALTDKNFQTRLLEKGCQLKMIKNYVNQRLRIFFQDKHSNEVGSQNLYFALRNFISSGGDELINEYLRSDKFNKKSFKKKFIDSIEKRLNTGEKDDNYDSLQLLINYALISSEPKKFISDFMTSTKEIHLKNIPAVDLENLRKEPLLYQSIQLMNYDPKQSQEMYRRYVKKITNTNQFFLAAEYGPKDQENLAFFKSTMDQKFKSQEISLSLNLQVTEREASRYLQGNHIDLNSDYRNGKKIHEQPLTMKSWGSVYRSFKSEEREILKKINASELYNPYDDLANTLYDFRSLSTDYLRTKDIASLDKLKTIETKKLEQIYPALKQLDSKHLLTAYLPLIYIQEDLNPKIQKDIENYINHSSYNYQAEFIKRLLEIGEQDKAKELVSKIINHYSNSNQLSLFNDKLQAIEVNPQIYKEQFKSRVLEENFNLDIDISKQNFLMLLNTESDIPYGTFKASLSEDNHRVSVAVSKNKNGSEKILANIHIERDSGKVFIENIENNYISVNGEKINHKTEISYGSYIGIDNDLYRLELGETRGDLSFSLVAKDKAIKLEGSFISPHINEVLNSGININGATLNTNNFHNILNRLDFHQDSEGKDVIIYDGTKQGGLETEDYLLWGPSKGIKIHEGLTGYKLNQNNKPISTVHIENTNYMEGLGLIQSLLDRSDTLPSWMLNKVDLKINQNTSSTLNFNISNERLKLISQKVSDLQAPIETRSSKLSKTEKSSLLFEQASSSIISGNINDSQAFIIEAINAAENTQQLLEAINLWTETLKKPLEDLKNKIDIQALNEKILNYDLKYQSSDLAFQLNSNDLQVGESGFGKVTPRSWDLLDLVELKDIFKVLGMNEAVSRMDTIHSDFQKLQTMADEANKLDASQNFNSLNNAPTLFFDKKLFHNFLGMLKVINQPLGLSESKYNLNTIYPALLASPLINSTDLAKNEDQVQIQTQIKNQILKQFKHAGLYYQCEFLSRLKFFNDQQYIKPLMQEMFSQIKNSDLLYKAIDEMRFQGFQDKELKQSLIKVLDQKSDFIWHIDSNEKNDFIESLSETDSRINLDLSKLQVSINQDGTKLFKLGKLVNDEIINLGEINFDAEKKTLKYHLLDIDEKISVHINGANLTGETGVDLLHEDLIQLGNDMFYLAKTNNGELAIHQIGHGNAEVINQLWLRDNNTHFEQGEIGQCEISALIAAMREDPSGMGLKLLVNSVDVVKDLNNDIIFSTRIKNPGMVKIDRENSVDQPYKWQRIAVAKSLRGYSFSDKKDSDGRVEILIGSPFELPINSVDMRDENGEPTYSENMRPSFGTQMNSGPGILGATIRKLTGDDYKYLVHRKEVIESLWGAKEKEDYKLDYYHTPVRYCDSDYSATLFSTYVSKNAMQKLLDTLSRSGQAGIITSIGFDAGGVNKEISKKYPEIHADHCCALGSHNGIDVQESMEEKPSSCLLGKKILMINPWNTETFRSFVDIEAISSTNFSLLQWDTSNQIQLDCVFN
jgi:hypothetical protein